MRRPTPLHGRRWMRAQQQQQAASTRTRPTACAAGTYLASFFLDTSLRFRVLSRSRLGDSDRHGGCAHVCVAPPDLQSRQPHGPDCPCTRALKHPLASPLSGIGTAKKRDVVAASGCHERRLLSCGKGCLTIVIIEVASPQQTISDDKRCHRADQSSFAPTSMPQTRDPPFVSLAKVKASHLAGSNPGTVQHDVPV